MLQKVGFFHFGTSHDDPKSALERALDETRRGRDQPSGADSDSTDALIVLPEAFNIGVSYRGNGNRNFERSILCDLQDVARRFRVGFVAGLIIYERCGPKPPHSAAYLIDGTGSTLMGYKIGYDDKVGCNYTERKGKADCHNPIRYRDVWVGALICVDGHFPPTNAMAPVLRDRRDGIVNASRVVCILAHMGIGNLCDGKSGSSVALTSGWENKIMVLANSNPEGVDSFITDSRGMILEPTVGGPNNRIVTLPLA